MSVYELTVHAPPDRVRQVEAVFGSATVPVRWPAPRWAELPELGRQLVYEVAVEELNDEQIERLYAYSEQRFGMSREEAELELKTGGFPMLAENTTVVGDLRMVL